MAVNIYNNIIINKIKDKFNLNNDDIKELIDFILLFILLIICFLIK